MIYLRNFYLAAAGLFSLGLAQAQINVTSYGAKPDGVTDNTAAFNTVFALAKANPGQKIYFPCNAGGTAYMIRSPITFPAHTTLQGDNASDCKIFYSPLNNPGVVPAAFSFINAGDVVVRDLVLQTGSAFPPQAITIMGGIHGLSSHNTLDTVMIRGYATQVMSYSIASEVNTYRNVTWELDGGGALYGFYTSAIDDLGICSACLVGSNLALFFSGNSFTSFDNNYPVTAVADKIGGGTGDHYFRDNAFSLNYVLGSIGFEFITGTVSQGGPNGQVQVFSTRIENGGFGLYFKLDSQINMYNLDVEGVTWVSSTGTPSYFAYGENGLNLIDFRMVHNTANQNGITGPSSFDSLIQSTIDESYGPITVRTKATNNVLTMRGSASMLFPANSSQNLLIANGVLSTH
jgi:hypothetical protein